MLEMQLKCCPNRIGELQPRQLLRMAGWLHAFACLWYHYGLP